MLSLMYTISKMYCKITSNGRRHPTMRTALTPAYPVRTFEPHIILHGLHGFSKDSQLNPT